MPHGGHAFGQIKYFVAIFEQDHLYSDYFCKIIFNSKEEDV